MRQHLLYARTVATTVLVTFLSGCSALDVNAPTTIRLGDLDNANGATLEVNGIRSRISDAMRNALPEAVALSDEFIASAWGFEAAIGLRKQDSYINFWLEDPKKKNEGAYYRWQGVWQFAASVLPHVRTYSAGGPRGPQVAEALAYRGYAMLTLAEQICPGFPVADVEVNGEGITPKFNSVPLTTDSAFKRALADLDSAVVYAGDTGRVSYMAKVWRGRALLGLGRAAEAAAAVNGVPTDFADSVSMQFVTSIYQTKLIAMNREGQNGIDYITAHDPRVSFRARRSRCTGCLFGDSMYYYNPYIVNGTNAYVKISSGLEARLIEAEGQLATAPDGSAWLNTLNTLRAQVALSDTTDPGTADSRLNLLFRERGFWFFATGHRLGDMRRLIAKYGRAPETVFPTGETPWGGGAQYGTAMSIPFDGVLEHQLNPKITGCTSL